MNYKITKLIFFGILVLTAFITVNAALQSGFSFLIDFGEGFQNLPNYLVGCATVFSIGLLYLTLKAQRESTQLSAFENRFFKFMDYHRENVNQLKYRDPNQEGEKYWDGNQVFTVIYYEIRDLITEFKKTGDPLKKVDAETINFIFQCIFYGAGEDGMRVLLSIFPEHKEFLQSRSFENKFSKYWNGKKKEKYYSGHVRRLGHYYRNIYQAIKYIEAQTFLTEKQKYQYTTHYRAQMSVYEQSVFFFNSISFLGQVWEWENYLKSIPENVLARRLFFKNFYITKYDLVRNTLHNDGVIFHDIKISQFYPLITLERKEECSVFGTFEFNNKSITLCRYCFNEKYINYYDRKSLKQAIEDAKQYFSVAAEKELNNFRCNETSCRTTQLIKEEKDKRAKVRSLKNRF